MKPNKDIGDAIALLAKAIREAATLKCDKLGLAILTQAECATFIITSDRQTSMVSLQWDALADTDNVGTKVMLEVERLANEASKKPSQADLRSKYRH